MPTGGHSTTSIPRPRPSAAARAAAEASAPRRGSSSAASGRRAASPGSTGRGAQPGRSSKATKPSRSTRAAKDDATPARKKPSRRGASTSPTSKGRATGRRSRTERADGASNRAGSSIRTRRSARDTGSGARHDLTKAIPVEKRLVAGRRKRWVLVGAATVLFGAFAAALFVLPIKAWFRQQDDIARKQTELAALEQANAKLNEEVAALNTPEGIEEAARSEIGYVRRGEIQLTVLPLPETSSVLPAGWPFDAAAQILTLRSTTPLSVENSLSPDGEGTGSSDTAAP